MTVGGRRVGDLPHCPTAGHAIDADCPHRGGPLQDGLVADSCVTCPLHGRRFDLRTGAQLGGERRGRRARGASSATARCWLRAVRGASSDRRQLERTRQVRTGCPYCGTGCGLIARGRRRAAGRRSRATRCIPSTAARPAASRCGCPRRSAPADRATDAAAGATRSTTRWRPRTWRQTTGELARRLTRRPASATGPDAIALLHLRPAADRGLLRRRQARQGLPRHQQRRLELAAVHVLARSPATAARSAPTGRRPATPTSTRPTASCCWGRTRRPAIRSSGRGSARRQQEGAHV